MTEDKVTRELWMNYEKAYRDFHTALAEFIQNAEYPVDDLMRGLDDKITTATIHMPGGGKVLFRRDEWQVILPIKDNPVNPKLLEDWERKEIHEEILYHNDRIRELIKRRQELNSKTIAI